MVLGVVSGLKNGELVMAGVVGGDHVLVHLPICILVCDQPTTRTQPGQPCVGRHNEYL